MKISVLIVDDSISIQFILGDILRTINIENVIFASNGLEAVEKYKKHKPDIVLLDVMMPEYDGLYALKGIKKINPKAKVILVTATEDIKILEKMKKIGVFEIIQKPFEITKITTVVKNALKTNYSN